jgi:hypothetical protein
MQYIKSVNDAWNNMSVKAEVIKEKKYLKKKKMAEEMKIKR